jgi:hypothetical protein
VKLLEDRSNINYSILTDGKRESKERKNKEETLKEDE